MNCEDATGDSTATVYQFECELVAYFGLNAPDFREAGES